MTVNLSDAQKRVLLDAIRRLPDYPVCPTRGLNVAPQMAVLRSLKRKGLIQHDGRPVLTELGIRVATQLLEE